VGLLLNILTLPVLGAPRLVHWMAVTVAEHAEREFLDEGRVRGELLDLQERFEAGGLGEEEYERQEQALLDMLKTIRKLKEERAHQEQ